MRIGATLLVLSIAGLLALGVANARSAEPAHISIGPYDDEATCLMEGNQRVEHGELSADYECVGGPGAWYIDAVPVQPRRWSSTQTGMFTTLIGGAALTNVLWIALALLLPRIPGFFPGFDNDTADSCGGGGDSSDGGWNFWGGDSGGDSGGGGD